MIILIACIHSETGGIGYDNKLLFNLKRDMAFFKKTTLHKTIVFGRETYEHLPIHPLPNRTNIVLTRNKTLQYEGAIMCTDIEQIIELSKKEDVYICGGSVIYEQFLPYVDKALLTFVSSKSIATDTFFPLNKFMNNPIWQYKQIDQFKENDCLAMIVECTKMTL